MSQEDDTHIVKGLPPLLPIANVTIGRFVYEKLLANCTDDDALIDAFTDDRISYKQLLWKTCLLSQKLRQAGLTEMSTVAISSENTIHFFTPLIATLYIGATITTFNHAYTETETLHALKIAQPELVFCSKKNFTIFNKLKSSLGTIKKIVVIDGDPNSIDCESLDRLLNETTYSKDVVARTEITDVNLKEHVAFILYSSGTTGLPKGVMITHYNILTWFNHQEDPRFIKINKSKTAVLGLLPFYHAYGLFVGLAGICRNYKIIVMNRFDEKIYLGNIEKYKIKALALVPPIAIFLAKTILFDQYDLSSVEEIGCGAAPLSKNIESLLKQRFQNVRFRQGYGLTETTLGVSYSPIERSAIGSVGKICPYIIAKIRDPESGRSLGVGQVGEICIKGPLVMKGYFKNAEATRNAFTTDGWLLTGDLGYFDKDEFLYIVGRLKELIKYKGYQVPPVELEAILLTNPKIRDAAVVGLPDEKAGELPLAFVVKNIDCDVTAEEIKQFVAEKVSPQKRLRGGVIFVPEIPKNPTGKILRNKLQGLLRKHLKAKM